MIKMIHKKLQVKVGKLFPYIDSLTLWDRYNSMTNLIPFIRNGGLETDLISPPNLSTTRYTPPQLKRARWLARKVTVFMFGS